MRPADHDRLIELMEGVEDIPGAALHEGLSWTWQSFPEFLDALDGRPFDVDVAIQVPHGALRLHVMGERGAQREPATPEDIEAMAKLGRRGDRGRRARLHHVAHAATTAAPTASPRRRSPPRPTSCSASREPIGATGKGVLQVVSDFVDVDAEFALFRRMAEESGRPLSFSLAGVDPATYPRQLELLEEANAAGVPMRGQVAARAVGILLGLQCTLHPLARQPGVPGDRRRCRGRAGARHARARASRSAFLARPRRSEAARRTPTAMFELGDPPDYEPDPSTSIAARAGAGRPRPRSTWPTTCSRDDEGRTFLYLPFLNYADGNLDARAARCSPTRTPSPAWPTAAPTSARSATPASRRRCSPTGAATGTDGRHRPRRSSCSARPRTPPRPSACSTAACSPPATGPTST